MTASIRHSAVAAGSDNPNRQVSVDAWNDDHTIAGLASRHKVDTAADIVTTLDSGDGIPISVEPGSYTLATLTRPVAGNVQFQMSPGANLTGGKIDFKNIIPYIPAPVVSPDLYSRTYGSEWNGTKNVFQRASYAKSEVARGGVGVGPAVVAVYGMGDAAVSGAAAWGCNFVGYASVSGGVAIANETDSGALVSGGIAYNTVLVATGYYPTVNALQIQANKVGGEFVDGIVFNNRASTAIDSSGDPVVTDINAVTGTQIYSDAGTAERLVRSLSTYTISEWESQNFVIGASYVPAGGLGARYARLDATSGGVYIRARDGLDASTTLYLASVSTGSVQFLTGRTAGGGEVSQVEVKHFAAATERLTLTGGTTDVAISTSGSATNSSISIQGRGTNAGVKLKDNTGTIKFQVNGTGIGFYGTAGTAKPTVSGSRGGNAALASLLTGLAALGLITDSSTA